MAKQEKHKIQMKAYKEYMERGCSPYVISEEYGFKKTWLSSFISTNKLPNNGHTYHTDSYNRMKKVYDYWVSNEGISKASACRRFGVVASTFSKFIARHNLKKVK